MIVYQETYKVNLPLFEGPLDLLLHLIKKKDLDISNIPITEVLNQYNEYLNLMQELNIDLAGEFILMAAELTHIKSRMLLPVVSQNDEEEGEDPRAELAKRLLEYQRFKDAAQNLILRPQLNRDVFTRLKYDEEDIVQEEAELQVDVFKLLKAFQKVLQKVKVGQVHQVYTEKLSVTQRMYELIDSFKDQDFLAFDSLFENLHTRSECVVTFLAVLEMVRLKLVLVHQSDDLSSLSLVYVGEKKEVAEVSNSEFDQESV